MKFTFNDITHILSGKGQISINTREKSKVFRGVMLIILVIALAACKSSQQASSGGDVSARGTSTSDTSSTATPSGNAGRAVLNLDRSVTYYYSNGPHSSQTRYCWNAKKLYQYPCCARRQIHVSPCSFDQRY